MATHAPPQTPPDTLGDDAFAAVARKLDALLEAQTARSNSPGTAARVDPTADTPGDAETPNPPIDAEPPVEPVTPAQVVDPPAPMQTQADPPGTSPAAELLALLDQTQPDSPQAVPGGKSDAGGDLEEALEPTHTPNPAIQPEPQPDPRAAAEATGDGVTAPHPDTESAESAGDDPALAELDALLAQPPAAPPETVAVDAPRVEGTHDSPPSPPADTGLDVPPNPSTADLDAELEALLAEAPIDPEVLHAAEAFAKQDAEEAERNQEALRQRAEEASQALAQAAQGEPADEADDALAHDDITAEINSLLAAEETNAADETDTEAAHPVEDPTIDQIDAMLAQGADDGDDEIDGSFYSAQDVAADNLTGPGEPMADDAAVPEAYASADPAADDADTPPEDGPGKLTLREKAERYGPPALRLAGRLALHACWGVNWPARKFLTTQWRATLGYIALLQAAGALAVWLYLVVL